jgi:toxin HigB-1
VIRSFRHKGLEAFFTKGDGRRLPPEMLPRVRNLLFALHEATGVEELSLATFRLHALKGNRKGHGAVTVRANWRIGFRFEGTMALDVDFLDYH